MLRDSPHLFFRSRQADSLLNAAYINALLAFHALEKHPATEKDAQLHSRLQALVSKLESQVELDKQIIEARTLTWQIIADVGDDAKGMFATSQNHSESSAAEMLDAFNKMAKSIDHFSQSPNPHVRSLIQSLAPICASLTEVVGQGSETLTIPQYDQAARRISQAMFEWTAAQRKALK
jgi:hypothetical protein